MSIRLGGGYRPTSRRYRIIMFALIIVPLVILGALQALGVIS